MGSLTSLIFSTIELTSIPFPDNETGFGWYLCTEKQGPACWKREARVQDFLLEGIRRSPVEVGGLSHYLQGFHTSRVVMA